MPGIEPRAAGYEARMLSIVLAGPLPWHLKNGYGQESHYTKNHSSEGQGIPGLRFLFGLKL